MVTIHLSNKAIGETHERFPHIAHKVFSTEGEFALVRDSESEQEILD